jgi:hypothetical protein
MRRVKNILKHWLPLVVVITAMCGLVYLSVQQAMRHSANDPQIQMAEDAADALTRGDPVESVLPASQVDLSRSLAPFVIVFNDSGETVASNGLLHGSIPAFPPGVFGYVRKNGEDRITWQPEPGVRIASVVMGYSGNKPGFIVVGRSLREVEIREDQVQTYAGLAWIVTVLGSLIMVTLVEFFLSDRKTTGQDTPPQ